MSVPSKTTAFFWLSASTVIFFFTEAAQALSGSTSEGKPLAELQKEMGLFNANQGACGRMSSLNRITRFSNYTELRRTIYVKDSLIHATKTDTIYSGVHILSFLEPNRPNIEADKTMTTSSYRWSVTGPNEAREWDPVAVADLKLNFAENVSLGSKTASFDFSKADFRLFYQRAVADVDSNTSSKDLHARPLTQTATIVIRDPKTHDVTTGYECQLDPKGEPVVASINKLGPKGSAAATPPDPAFRNGVALVFQQAFAETLEKAALARNHFLEERTAYLAEHPEQRGPSGGTAGKP